MPPILGSDQILSTLFLLKKKIIPQINPKPKPFFPFMSSFQFWPEIAVPTTPPGQWEQSLKERGGRKESVAEQLEQSSTCSP